MVHICTLEFLNSKVQVALLILPSGKSILKGSVPVSHFFVKFLNTLTAEFWIKNTNSPLKKSPTWDVSQHSEPAAFLQSILNSYLRIWIDKTHLGVSIMFSTSVKDLSGVIKAGIFPTGPAQPQKLRYKLCFWVPWLTRGYFLTFCIFCFIKFPNSNIFCGLSDRSFSTSVNRQIIKVWSYNSVKFFVDFWSSWLF